MKTLKNLSWFSRLHALRMGGFAASAIAIGSALAHAQTPPTASGGSPRVAASTSTVTRQLVPSPPRRDPTDEIPNASQKSGAQQLSANAGLVFIADGNPQLVGYGFTFDPQSGDWKVRQPAAPIVLDSSYVLDSMYIDLLGSTIEGTQSSSSLLSISASAAYGLVKAAAQLSQQQSASSSQFANEFKFVIKKQYEPKMLDLAQAASLAYLPAAQQILAITDPVERATQWKNTFGEYLAIGFDVRAYVGLKVSLTQTESTMSKSSFLAIQGQYKTLAGSVSAGLSFGQLAKQALASSGISLSLTYEGSVTPAITIPADVSQIDDPQEQADLVNNLYTSLANSYAKRGLILIPWSAIPGAPVFDTNTFAGPAVGEAGFVAQTSLELLQDAQRYNYPASLQAFLDNRIIPGTTVSYGEKLNQSRSALIEALDDLWLKLVAHGIAPTSQSSNDLLMAAAAVKVAQGVGSADGLIDTLGQLESMADALPPMVIGVQENLTPPPSAPSTDIWPVQYVITLKNVAFFSNWTYGIPWLKAYDALTDTGAIVMYEDAIASGYQSGGIYTGDLAPSTFANGQLYTPIMISKVPSMTPGCEGLYDVKFLLMANDWVATKFIHMKSTDDLGRSAYIMYDRSLNNPF